MDGSEVRWKFSFATCDGHAIFDWYNVGSVADGRGTISIEDGEVIVPNLASIVALAARTLL